jgi:hypothetical protein
MTRGQSIEVIKIEVEMLNDVDRNGVVMTRTIVILNLADGRMLRIGVPDAEGGVSMGSMSVEGN